MPVYLLASVVALVTIFGLAHSQTAREKLHLQNAFIWYAKTIQQQLENLAARNNEDDDILEIIVSQTVIPKKVESSKLMGDIDEASETSNPRLPSMPKPSGIPRIKRPSTNAKDNVLAAINASLKKLSSAANSGRINGTQLYNILLQETMRQEEMEIEETSNPSTVTIDEVDENAEELVKPRMYFGESPLEYVPHQKD